MRKTKFDLNNFLNNWGRQEDARKEMTQWANSPERAREFTDEGGIDPQTKAKLFGQFVKESMQVDGGLAKTLSREPVRVQGTKKFLVDFLELENEDGDPSSLVYHFYPVEEKFTNAAEFAKALHGVLVHLIPEDKRGMVEIIWDEADLITPEAIQAFSNLPKRFKGPGVLHLYNLVDCVGENHAHSFTVIVRDVMDKDPLLAAAVKIPMLVELDKTLVENGFRA